MVWTDPAAVLALTGEQVTAQHCAVASAMIDTKAGTHDDLPEDAISPRDRKILQRAAAWQAPFVKARPWLFTQVESTRQTSAAGVTDRRDSDTALLYAPMTILELRNLSWTGTRTEWPAYPKGRVSFLNEASDVCGTWQPL